MVKSRSTSGESRDAYFLSGWCNSPWKRALDIVGAISLLILSLPIMVLVALAVKLTSKGPVLFRQRRPGRNGREFGILKFRTMLNVRQDSGPVLTRADDPRVTPLGRYLRKWKLDELPQLFNVLGGTMSFVGPRPQPTKLWIEPSIQEEASYVLSVRPGITSDATLHFRNEEELLAPLGSEEVEDVYLRTIMPVKLKMELEYLRNASLAGDLTIALTTILRILHPRELENQLSVTVHVQPAEPKKLRAAAGEGN